MQARKMDEELETESELEKNIGEFFLDHGFFCQKTPKVKTWGKRRMNGRLSMSGSPDLFIIHRGRYVGLEVKKPKGKLSMPQEIYHEHLKRAGANVYKVCSLEDALVILKVLRSIN